MVPWFLTAGLVLLLAGTSAVAAPARQLCLACHPVHYAGLGSCTACHRGNPDSDRKNIAHQGLIAGRYARFTLRDEQQFLTAERLLKQYACRRCHVIGGTGNRLSVNLDQATVRRSPEQLAVALRRPVQNMPDFRLAETQVTELVNALLLAARRQPKTAAVRPQMVHFNQTDAAGKDIFSVKCGPCHRVLTERLGGLGQGAAGPNLSGLLTPWYPETYRAVAGWNVERLRRWLDNPRAIRSGVRMLPVKLDEQEFIDLVGILRVENRD